MTTIGLIGLGNAGRPMAQRLLSKGHDLTVFDIDREALDAVVNLGGHRAASASAAVRDVTITLLPSAIEVRRAVFGADGALLALRAGKTLIDLSGTDPDCARELQERIKQIGGTFVGGTIHASGAPAVVIPDGRFAIVVGGARPELDSVIGLLQDLAQTIICLPEPWMPKAFKMAIILYATTNNIISAEICSWLATQGADPKLFLQLLQTTGSEASATRMREFMQRDNNHGGALSNSYKDFRQALDVAAKLEIPMPLASMANQIQEMARAAGFARLNSPAALGKLYELLAGADLSTASMAVEKRLPPTREPRVVFLPGKE